MGKIFTFSDWRIYLRGSPKPPYGPFGGPTPQQIADAVRAGDPLTDWEFDRFMPHQLRILSAQYWTPLSVSLCAARWLEAAGARTVLDIGSGAGKFCVSAALATKCRFIGLEQRPRLVEAGRELARVFEVGDRVGFVQGELGAALPDGADAFYLFNPFGENLYDAGEGMDADVELGVERYKRDVAAIEDLLRRMPVGTCVVTYNGFGGRVPDSFVEVHVDRTQPNLLRMWRKERATGSGSFFWDSANDS
jgi:SAM-dependent methyltransferase